MNKKYNIGLDIGTTSVGWAVVEDGNQKIMRKGNKALWGVRLFEEASTAADRREFRSTRRRYDRRRNRIKLLQEEFTEEMNKVDNEFFKKLQESKYNELDKINKTIHLTKEEKQAIKDYNDNYPTIYHLRNRLIIDKTQEDIRLIYLAIHHLIKYRGNFLYGNSSFNVNNLNLEEKLKSVFSSLQNNVETLEIPDDYDELIDFKKLSELLLNPSKNDIKVGVKEQLSDVMNKTFISELGKLVVGNKFNVNKLFMIEDADSKIEINFNGTDYDDKYTDLENLLGDKIESLEELKELYDTIFLKRLFKGSNNASISELMVEKYEQHNKDLKLLKGLFKNNRKLYNKLLRSQKNICIYEQYINNKISNEDFIKELKKLLEELFDSNVEIEQEFLTKYEIDMKQRIDNGEFLPRITDNENGKYPYQLNKDELIKIIENQGKYYPFLLNKTEDGVYKIVKILEFKIPYYVGPLVSEKRSKFAWMERKINNVKITPYNFDEVIDKEKTAEKFIKRMISHCTYLLDEYALPNNSIFYSRYKVLNELKQIKVNDISLTNEHQQKIIKDFFEKTSGAITNAKFVDYLRNQSDFNMYDEINVRGYSADNKFANNLQSYYDFFGPNGIFEGTNYNEDEADEIIEWITIFDDKDILENKVRNNYPALSDKQVKSILVKKHSGWGSLSKKLLSTKYYKDKETEVYKSIIDLMNETDENFMQIINNDKYNFQQMIKEHNKIKDNKKLSYDVVEPLATSPSTKRGIYQALKIVEELVNYIGYEPSNIMIEMARGEEEKKRKDDRKKYLTKLYDEQSKEIENYNKLKRELDEHEVNTQKMFLYFIQEGKCLYSGRPLNIEDLDSYEIDHIIPRTLIKDDSIDNKALVYRECNQTKAASYVLPREYRNDKNRVWWQHLKKIKLISPKKFHNLIRDKYSTEDIEGFINRQLVETRQITKHVANILNSYYKNTKVVYLKANLSHNYRERYELFKFREINDYHHAHDAYLAAVLGEYKEKYMKKKINFEMVKELNNRLREQKEYKNLKYGYVINSLDENASDIINQISKNFVNEETGEVLFDAHEFNQIIENTLYRNDILVSRKTEVKSGKFYKETIYKKGQGNVPIKDNMPVETYGGYTSVINSYLCIVKYKDKKKLIAIPTQIAIKVKQDGQVISKFIKEHLGLKENESVEILKDKIPFEKEINYLGQNVYIKGYSISHKNCEIANAYQLKISKENMMKWKEALQYILNNKEQYKIEATKVIDDILRYLLLLQSKYPLFEKELTKIKEKLNTLELTLEDKKKIIVELFKLFHCNSVNANLKTYGLGDRVGRLASNNITSGILISKSITGIKETKYEF